MKKSLLALAVIFLSLNVFASAQMEEASTTTTTIIATLQAAPVENEKDIVRGRIQEILENWKAVISDVDTFVKSVAGNDLLKSKLTREMNGTSAEFERNLSLLEKNLDLVREEHVSCVERSLKEDDFVFVFHVILFSFQTIYFSDEAVLQDQSLVIQRFPRYFSFTEENEFLKEVHSLFKMSLYFLESILHEVKPHVNRVDIEDVKEEEYHYTQKCNLYKSFERFLLPYCLGEINFLPSQNHVISADQRFQERFSKYEKLVSNPRVPVKNFVRGLSSQRRMTESLDFRKGFRKNGEKFIKSVQKHQEEMADYEEALRKVQEGVERAHDEISTPGKKAEKNAKKRARQKRAKATRKAAELAQASQAESVDVEVGDSEVEQREEIQEASEQKEIVGSITTVAAEKSKKKGEQVVYKAPAQQEAGVTLDLDDSEDEQAEAIRLLGESYKEEIAAAQKKWEKDRKAKRGKDKKASKAEQADSEEVVEGVSAVSKKRQELEARFWASNNLEWTDLNALRAALNNRGYELEILPKTGSLYLLRGISTDNPNYVFGLGVMHKPHCGRTTIGTLTTGLLKKNLEKNGIVESLQSH